MAGDPRARRTWRRHARPAAAARPEPTVAGGAAGARPAGAEPVDLLASSPAGLARADPLQPDVPATGPERQRQPDLLDGRLDPGNVPPRRDLSAEQQDGAGDHAVLDAGPVVRQQHPALGAASEE